MNLGRNDLLEECYRRLARDATHMDIAITLGCLAAVILLGAFA